nr:hypothetical protein CFP56_71763 [Quercus suber]
MLCKKQHRLQHLRELRYPAGRNYSRLKLALAVWRTYSCIREVTRYCNNLPAVPQDCRAFMLLLVVNRALHDRSPARSSLLVHLELASQLDTAQELRGTGTTIARRTLDTLAW